MLLNSFSHDNSQQNHNKRYIYLKKIGLTKYIAYSFLSFGWLGIISFTVPCFSQETYVKVRALEEEFKFSNLDGFKKSAQNWKIKSNQEAAVRPWLEGLYSFYNSDHNEAYFHFFEAYTISQSTTNNLLTAEIAMDLAKVYSLIELTGRSLALLHEIEKTILEEGSSIQKARYYIQLGELYRRMSKFEKAMISLDMAENYIGDNQKLFCYLLNRRAAVYTELNNHELSKELSLQALKIAKEIDNPDFEALSYNELAFLDRHTEKKDSVFAFYSRADALWTSIGMDRYASNTRLQLSIWYGVDSLSRDLHKSLDIAHSARKLSEGRGWDFLEFEIFEHMSNLHQELNAIDSAKLYKIKSYDAYLSYLDKRNDAQTMIIEAEYTQSKSEELLREQRVKLKFEEEQNENIKKESTLYFVIMVISILVIILLSIILSMNRAKRNKAIEIAKNEALIRLSLEQSLDEKNILLAEVNHRVKNNLQTMSSLIDLQRLSESSELVKSSLFESQRRIEAMGIIHEMLYASEFMHKVDIRMYVKHLIDSEKMIYEGLHDTISFEVAVESIQLDINQCINLGMIISEFISNSFKHAFLDTSHPEIIISLKQLKEEVELKVSDNGTGICNEKLNQGESKSLGLKLISIFCKKLHGHHYLSGGLEGTILTVLFPKVKT